MTTPDPSTPAPAETGPLRILCVGDSITQGGKAGREEHTYRLPLQRKLHAAGIPFRFLGSRTGGDDAGASWPGIAPGIPFDPRHEGYYGQKTETVTRLAREAWIPGSPAPDIVLIHLGTNDQEAADHAADVGEPLRGFIAFLRSLNPRVIVLLGHLNFNDSPGASAIRPLVESLASELDSPLSPVRTVPHHEGWQEHPDHPEPDTFDWAHPNPQGQEKMAVKWLAAMAPFLPAAEGTLP